jgi:radical SAM protein with 4Fe4S-binding SPASM domain
MSIRWYWGKAKARGRILHAIRKALPRAWRMGVYRRNAFRVMRQEGFSEKVPLFRSIEIETRTRCNSACSFCAANFKTDQRADILMPTELFHKIIADLKRLDYSGKVNFFVNNEPLLDNRLAEFIRHVRSELPKASAEVHTNGLKLNARIGRELMEAGLQVLYINNYTTEGKVHRGVQEFLDQVAPDFPDREVHFFLRLLEEKLLNRAGTAPNGTLLRQPLPQPCVLPFTEMVVTADGRVSLCCQDHYFEEVMGNVRQQPIEEIWHGPAFARLREALLRGDRTASKFCEVCDFRGYRDDHLRHNGFANRLAGPVTEL